MRVMKCAIPGLVGAAMLQSVSRAQSQPEGATLPDSLVPAELRSSHGLSFHARPAPDCRSFVLTNAGGYIGMGTGTAESRLRGIADWGAMVNVNRRNAVGA